MDSATASHSPCQRARRGATHASSKPNPPSAALGESTPAEPAKLHVGRRRPRNAERRNKEDLGILSVRGQRRATVPVHWRLRGTLQTTMSLERDKGCVQLSRLVVPAATQAVFATIEKTRRCLTAKGLSVNGGLALREPHPQGAMPPPRQGQSDGELRIDYGEGSVTIGYYENPTAAKRHEATVAQRVKSIGGQVERQGAVDILWIAPPPNLRQRLKACGLR